MFDDLDDLLDDIPANKSKPQAKPAPASTAFSKAKSTKPSEDEFDWEKPSASKAPTLTA